MTFVQLENKQLSSSVTLLVSSLSLPDCSQVPPSGPMSLSRECSGLLASVPPPSPLQFEIYANKLNLVQNQYWIEVGANTLFEVEAVENGCFPKIGHWPKYDEKTLQMFCKRLAQKRGACFVLSMKTFNHTLRKGIKKRFVLNRRIPPLHLELNKIGF